MDLIFVPYIACVERAVGWIQQASPITGCLQKPMGEGRDMTSRTTQGERAAHRGLFREAQSQKIHKANQAVNKNLLSGV